MVAWLHHLWASLKIIDPEEMKIKSDPSSTAHVHMYVNDNILGIYCLERTFDEDDNSLEFGFEISAISDQAEYCDICNI